MSLGITVMLYTLKLTWLVTLYLVLASGFRNHMLVGSRYTYERECSDTVLDYESLRSIAQTHGLTINVQDYIMFLNVQIQREDCTLGHLSAFVQPGGILHLESIVVNPRNALDVPKARIISLLLGAHALLWRRGRGCTRAQLLSIYDSNIMHSYGFQTIKEVGGGASSLLDRIVWGGTGSLMEANISACLGVLQRNIQHAEIVVRAQ